MHRFALSTSLSLLCLCACETAGGGGAGMTSSTAKPLTAEGSFTATIDGADHTVDYSKSKVDIVMSHKLNTDPKGLSCVPEVSLTAANADGSCKLVLDFKVGFDGGTLLLDNAHFYAVTGPKQGDVLLERIPCAGWTTEPKKTGEVIYDKVSGDATLNMSPVPQPYAGQATAHLSGLYLQPQGVVTMKFQGRQFQLDLSTLRFKGDAISKGSADIACAQTFHAFPDWQLLDIQAKSPGFGTTYGLSTFQGKRVAVLTGAGWCNSCLAQATSMAKIQGALAAQGHSDIQMVVINDKTATSAADQKAMTDATIVGSTAVPVFQASAAVDGWALQGGDKGDGFIYALNGKLVFHFKGTDPLNITDWEAQLNKYLTMSETDLEALP